MAITRNTHSFKMVFVTLLFCLFPFSVTLADDDDYPMMGPMAGCPMMGSGQMGKGPMMGMGSGGMGQMGGPMMGMGSMNGMGMMPMMGMQNNFYMLDLTDAQRKAMRDIQRKMRTDMLAIHDKMDDLNDQLSTEYSKDKPDAKKIGELSQQLFTLQRQMIELHINVRNQQYDQLTKEQQAKLKEMRGPRGMMPQMMR